MMLGSEQRYVVDTFLDAMGPYKDKDILIYGIGKNTKAVLENVSDFRIIGLMDRKAEGEKIYGCPVYSESEAISGYHDDRIIVIIARESVADIIYKRICHLQEECGIPILDYKGLDFSKRTKTLSPMDIPYWSHSYESLLRAIDEHDIISFDIFDTLLMRRVLQPEDVFELVELKSKIPFAKLRVQAEKNVGTLCPSLDEIYDEIGRISNLTKSQLLSLQEMEKKVDRGQLIPRTVVMNAFRYAIEQGKKVYILSDMYYPSDFLDELLQDTGIKGYEGIYVSNEMRATKEEGRAYPIFKDEVCRMLGQGEDFQNASLPRFLHIGDNRYADVEMAQKNGVDAYLVYSAYELLIASSMKELLIDPSSLSRRCMIGYLISELFADPFAICGDRGMVSIDCKERYGYIFIAPIINEYVRWMHHTIISLDKKEILFGARDGFLIKKIYDMFYHDHVKTTYFRTSRRCVSAASISVQGDIKKIALRGYAGTFAEFMMERFGVDASGSTMALKDIQSMNENEWISTVMEYEKDIFEEAEREKRNYLKYLDGVGIDDKNVKDAVIFDFVTSGTIPYYLSKLLDRKIPCICFATMNLPNEMYDEDDEDMFAAFGNIKSYGNDTEISRHYLILESILTDENSTFLYIDDEGTEIFADDGKNHQFSDIESIWKGIEMYCSSFHQLYGDILDLLEPELSFADMLFGMGFSENVRIADEIKQSFMNDDIYDGVEPFRLWK